MNTLNLRSRKFQGSRTVEFRLQPGDCITIQSGDGTWTYAPGECEEAYLHFDLFTRADALAHKRQQIVQANHEHEEC